MTRIFQSFLHACFPKKQQKKTIVSFSVNEDNGGDDSCGFLRPSARREEICKADAQLGLLLLSESQHKTPTNGSKNINFDMKLNRQPKTYRNRNRIS